jgi:glutathione S-transferase
MKIYAATGACGLHVQIVARELGLPFELVLVDLASKRTSTGHDYAHVTAKGYIPALELDDGRVLTEGAVITQYLADLRPDAGLLPPWQSFSHYRVLEWLHYIGTELHKAFGPLFKPSSDADKAQARADIARRLALVEAALAEADYLVDGRFGIADAYLYNILSWARPAGVSLQDFPALRAFVRRVSARPAVRASLIAEGLLRSADAA